MAAVVTNDSDGGPRASRERARERGTGANEGSTGLGRRRGDHPGVQGRGRQAGDVVVCSGTQALTSLPAWREEAAAWQGPAQCWACQVACDQVSGPGKILSLSLLLFLFFYYSVVFRALLKMSGHYQKS